MGKVSKKVISVNLVGISETLWPHWQFKKNSQNSTAYVQVKKGKLFLN